MIIFVVDSVRYTKVEIEFLEKFSVGFCVICAKSLGTVRLRRIDWDVVVNVYNTQYSPVGSKPIVAAVTKKIFKKKKKIL